jgi:hypothetical protein
MMVTGAFFGPRTGAASIGAGFVGVKVRILPGTATGWILRRGKTINALTINNPKAAKLMKNRFRIAFRFSFAGWVCDPGFILIVSSSLKKNTQLLSRDNKQATSKMISAFFSCRTGFELR